MYRRYLMKKNQCCPKCQSQDILYVLAKGVFRRNAYQDIVVDDRKLKVEQYICKKCGYVETYVHDDDLKKMEEL